MTRLNVVFLLWAVLTGFDPSANPLWPYDAARATAQLVAREDRWNQRHPCAIRECEGK